jgi:hypothetical protein
MGNYFFGSRGMARAFAVYTIENVRHFVCGGEYIATRFHELTGFYFCGSCITIERLRSVYPVKTQQVQLTGDSAARSLSRGLRRFLVPLALLMWMSTGVNLASAQTADKMDRIRGIVINRVTRAPVAHALVTSTDQRLAGFSDSEGRFEFVLAESPSGNSDTNSDVRASRFLLARKPGYLAENASGSATPASAAGGQVTLLLVPEAVIMGKISLPNAEAPDSIAVELYRRQVQDGRAHWFPAGAAQSRSDGEFRFADLAAGSYKLVTRELLDRDPLTFDPQGQLYGYPPVYTQNAPDFDASSTIQIAAGTTGVANLTVTRKAYHQVHIPVTNAQPETALTVDVFLTGHKGPGFSLGYNNRAQAIEGLLPDGNYTVEAFGFGNGPGTGSGTASISVSGGQVRGSAMTLVPNGLLQVDVTEQFTSKDDSSSIAFNIGQRTVRPKGPRRYLSVVLEPAEDSERNGAASLRNPKGPGDEALVIENARPGNYWVRVTSTRGYPASVHAGSVDLLHDPLVIAPGGSPPPIEIVMRDDTAEISGTVEGITPGTPAGRSEPIAGPVAFASLDGMTPAHVYCVPLADGEGQFAEVWVSPDGSFISPKLAPGAYLLLAFDQPQPELEYRNPDAMLVYQSRGQVIRVAGGQQEHARLNLISSSEQ